MKNISGMAKLKLYLNTLNFMNRNFFLVLISITLILTGGCKKYQENTVSRASIKSYAVNKWKVQQFTNFAGFDYSEAFYAYTIDLRKDNNYIESFYGDTWDGTWGLDTEKEKIVLTPAGNRVVEIWKILKLKRNELWIRSTDINWYEIHFITYK